MVTALFVPAFLSPNAALAFTILKLSVSVPTSPLRLPFELMLAVVLPLYSLSETVKPLIVNCLAMILPELLLMPVNE